MGVFCPFGTGEPIRSTAAAGKSWHSWRPTHVVIASYVELENTDKTPVAVRSDTDGGTLIVPFVWHTVSRRRGEAWSEVPVEHLLFTV